MVLRSVLAGSLISVVRQALVPSTKGDRYLLAADVLFNVGKVTQFIESGDWIGLESAIREEKLGASEFISMNTRLAELVRQGGLYARLAALQFDQPLGMAINDSAHSRAGSDQAESS